MDTRFIGNVNVSLPSYQRKTPSRPSVNLLCTEGMGREPLVGGGRIVLVAQFDGYGFQQYALRNHILGGMEVFLEMGRITVNLIGVLVRVHFNERQLGWIVLSATA